MNALVQAEPLSFEKAGAVIESVMIRGDLTNLNPTERAKFYTTVCKSVGLNPLTRPLEYVVLNGKLTLYARKDCTDQLRTIHDISVLDLIESEREGVYCITAKVQKGTGRTDMAKGAVSIGGLKGEALANALMKAETKAKRRATLSICGLGFLLDETEIEDMPSSSKRRRSRKATDATPVVWDENSERAPTADEVYEVAEARADEWAEVQGDRLANAVAAGQPATETKWDDLIPAQQSGILCNEVSFQQFMIETYPSITEARDPMAAASAVRKMCAVESRSQIKPGSPAALIWHELVATFRAWQSAPAVLPAENPATPPPTATQGAAGTSEQTESERIAALDAELADAAEKGTAALQAVWKIIPKADRDLLTAAKDRRHKPRAAEVDEQLKSGGRSGPPGDVHTGSKLL